MSDSDSDTDTDMHACDRQHNSRGDQIQLQEDAVAREVDWEFEAVELAEEEAALEVTPPCPFMTHQTHT